jgi:hypothetical protein
MRTLRLAMQQPAEVRPNALGESLAWMIPGVTLSSRLPLSDVVF